MKRFYHGTTSTLAEQIKREGLKPSPSRAFQLRDEEIGKLREKHNSVYLTTEYLVAEKFAMFRTLYERARLGDSVTWNAFVRKTKLADTHDASAMPAVLTIDLPEDWPVMRDLKSPHNWKCFKTTQPIPAEAITQVDDKVDSLGNLLFM